MQVVATTPLNVQPTLIDVNTNFGVDAGPLLLVDFDVINNEIFNILTTLPGERVFEPEFGSRIREFVFDPNDAKTEWLVENELIRALDRWMPYIQILRPPTKATASNDERIFYVEIYYRLRGVDLQGNFSFRLVP